MSDIVSYRGNGGSWDLFIQDFYTGGFGIELPENYEPKDEFWAWVDENVTRTSDLTSIVHASIEDLVLLFLRWQGRIKRLPVDAAAYYCPYIPLTMADTASAPMNFQTRIRVFTPPETP